MKTVFLRAVEAEDKPSAILNALRGEPQVSADGLFVAGPSGRSRFETDTATFQTVPGSPFSYWASDTLRTLFRRLTPFENGGRNVRYGLVTADDFRWLRLWWERAGDATDGPRLVPFVKGGAFSPFYASIDTAIRWGDDGRWLKEWKTDRLRQGLITPNNSKCWNESHYFRPGLTWPARSQTGLALRAMPAGCIFAGKGPSAFVPADDEEALFALLAVANSSSFRALVGLQMTFGSYEVGVIQRTPVPPLSPQDMLALAASARAAVTTKCAIDSRTETSHVFCLPAVLQAEGETLEERGVTWSAAVADGEADLAAIQADIDGRCFSLYGIDGQDREQIERGVGFTDDQAEACCAQLGVHEAETSIDAVGLAAELLSWAVGVAFGRFDVRLATGERETPSQLDAFDPLPVCSNGMLTGGDGLPASEWPHRYEIRWTVDGILVDDAGHDADLFDRVRAVFDVVFTEAADERWREASRLLGGNLRRWLSRSFFELHLKMYSKSRRKAPIYWQLATPTASYSVWLYACRTTADTMYRVLNDHVTPKLRHEERRLISLTQEAGSSPTVGQRQEIDSKRSFVEELRTLRDEIARIAPLWRPSLDDGILLTCSPLWRLVPRHRVWREECRAFWDGLADGEYDWSHIAMNLWPERVVPKCATDRSFAIAHGLEEVFWTESDAGAWTPRQVDQATVQRLVEERSSAAVAAAVAQLEAG